MTGDALVVWTVRASLALLTAGCVLRSVGRGGPARVCWAAGAGLMAAHLATAFAVVHGWSHADAVRETARQTAALTGLNWGGGVWANYLFAAVWAADAARRLLRPAADGAPLRRVDWAVGAFLGFVAVNGAVVFEDGPTRWIGVGCTLAVAAAAAVGRRRG